MNTSPKVENSLSIFERISAMAVNGTPASWMVNYVNSIWLWGYAAPRMKQLVTIKLNVHYRDLHIV